MQDIVSIPQPSIDLLYPGKYFLLDLEIAIDAITETILHLIQLPIPALYVHFTEKGL